MKDRFQAIDGLRGLAILWVTVFHLWGATESTVSIGGLDLTPLFRHGDRGVSLFFALSGFCLFYPLIKRQEFIPNWRTFYWRRVIRIMPAYLVAVLVWSLLQPVTWQDIISHLTFTHTLSYKTFWTITAPMWSLGTEIHYYLLFPVLAYCMYRKPGYTLAVAVLVTCAIRYHTFAGWNTYGDAYHPVVTVWSRSVLGRLLEFAAGMFAAWATARYPKPNKAIVVAVCALGLVALIGTPYILHVIGKAIYPARWWGAILLSMLYGCLIYAVVAFPKSSLCRLFSNPALVWIGVISYSLYLYNMMALWILRQIPGIQPGSTQWWLVGSISVLLAGCVGYYTIERPFLSMRTLSDRQSKPLPIKAEKSVS